MYRSYFIDNLKEVIKETDKKFNHAMGVIVKDTKFNYLHEISVRLSAQKEILFPMVYGNNKNSEVIEVYHELNKMNDKVMKEKEKMLENAEV